MGRLTVVDFRNAPFGLLVKRSPRYFRTRSIGAKHRDRTQLGIVVDLKFFPDSIAGVVCYPIIHWEGAASASMTHPSLAVPARRGIVLPKFDIADDA